MVLELAGRRRADVRAERLAALLPIVTCREPERGGVGGGRTAEISRMNGLRRRLCERQIERRGRVSSPQPVTGRRGWRGPSTTAGPPERPPFRIVVKYWDCFEGKQQKVCVETTGSVFSLSCRCLLLPSGKCLQLILGLIRHKQKREDVHLNEHTRLPKKNEKTRSLTLCAGFYTR